VWLWNLARLQRIQDEGCSTVYSRVLRIFVRTIECVTNVERGHRKQTINRMTVNQLLLWDGRGSRGAKLPMDEWAVTKSETCGGPESKGIII
jgi:hypothetical protein